MINSGFITFFEFILSSLNLTLEDGKPTLDNGKPILNNDKQQYSMENCQQAIKISENSKKKNIYYNGRPTFDNKNKNIVQ